MRNAVLGRKRSASRQLNESARRLILSAKRMSACGCSKSALLCSKNGPADSSGGSKARECSCLRRKNRGRGRQGDGGSFQKPPPHSRSCPKRPRTRLERVPC